MTFYMIWILKEQFAINILNFENVYFLKEHESEALAESLINY